VHRPKASITIRGSFSHEDYEHVCEALRAIGDAYSSMCSVETNETVVLISLHTCSSESEIDSIIRSVLSTSISELSIGVEKVNAESTC
jgi:hypothetical protein